MSNNPYLSQKAEIVDIIQETSSDLDIKTYKMKLANSGQMEFMPGQFIELSIPGFGAAPFGFASSPLDREIIELSIKKAGLLTEAVHNLRIGSSVWVRGPYGNTFPVSQMEESNVLFVAGGLGLAPLRPLILYMLNSINRDKYLKLQMLLAARSSGDFIYRRDYSTWEKTKDTNILLTIDRPEEGWAGKVGFPHIIIEEMDIDIYNTYVVLCGPPMMIKAVSGKLLGIGIPENRILTTLEMRMTCGVGKCGKCNIGHQYVCIDGPVFNMAQLSEMPNEY